MTVLLPTLFLLALLGWLLLPFLPAWGELHHRRDVHPLQIAEAYHEDTRKAPAAFAEGIKPHVKAVRQAMRTPLLPDDRSFAEACAQVELLGLPLDWSSPDEPAPGAPMIIVGSMPRRLAADRRFAGGIYALPSVEMAANSSVYGLYGASDISLGEHSVVEGWIYTKQQLRVGEGCVLRGSAAAGEMLRVEPGVAFEHLYAPHLLFGTPEDRPARPRPSPRLLPLTLDDHFDAFEQRAVVAGNLLIPSGHRFVGDLVVTGDLRVGVGSVLAGSVKVHGHVEMAANVAVEGHLFGRKDVRLEAGCQVWGVVSAEGHLRVENGGRFGRPDQPSTVCGEVVEMASGVEAFGTIWALKEGVVRAA